jgi:hypothetical protein
MEGILSDEKKDVPEVGAMKNRRAFVTDSAKVAITAPAVALLLSASVKSASALTQYQAQVSHILDDFTYGNNRDDFVGILDTPT